METTDGNYVLCGFTTGLTLKNAASSLAGSATSSIGASLIKMTPQGDTLWAQVFQGLHPLDGSAAFSILETADEGLLLAGATSTDLSGQLHIWLLKTDANGDSLWARTYMSGAEDIATSIVELDDGGFFIGARTLPANADQEDFLLLRLNADADLLWSKTYGGENDDFLQNHQQDS